VDPNAPLIDRIPVPPGTADPNSGALDLAKLASLQVMDQASTDILSSNQVGQLAWRGSIKGPDQTDAYTDRFAVTAAQFADQTGARAALTALSAHLDQLNYINDKSPFGDIPPGIDFHKDISTSKFAYYGMWVSGSALIQVHVWQDPAENETAMSGIYQHQVVSTLTNFPLNS
jgi:hypothetical protein